MSTTIPPLSSQVIYPESDGQPMAENTLQFEWIVTIKEGLSDLFRDDPDVFVAGDLLWYPLEGDPKTCAAPDAMVTLGRPRGHRGSYRQWEEGGLAPQVVFEVLSPGNTPREMVRKFHFYERFDVEEYYLFDPNTLPQKLDIWRREEPGGLFREVPETHGWVSPLLGIRFDLSGDELVIYRPDGRRFLTFEEMSRLADEEARRADEEAQRANEEAQRADEEARRANEEARRADEAELKATRLAARLKELGIDLDA